MEKTCPKCGAGAVLPVLYGELVPPIPEDAIIGGCCVVIEGMDWRGKKVFGTPDLGCGECGHRWVSAKQIRDREALARSARDRE